MSGPKIAIIIYTLYGHIGVCESYNPDYWTNCLSWSVAEAVKAGIEAAGGTATILQSVFLS